MEGVPGQKKMGERHNRRNGVAGRTVSDRFTESARELGKRWGTVIAEQVKRKRKPSNQQRRPQKGVKKNGRIKGLSRP